MKFCLCLIFLCFATFSFGLSDETERLIKKGEESFLNGEHDNSIYYFNLATTNSRRSPKEVGEAYLVIGQFYSTNGIHEQALKYYFNALRESIRDSDDYLTQDVYNSIGGSYYDRMHYLEAQKYWNLSKEINESISNEKGLSSNLNNLGEIDYLAGNYWEAIKTYKKSALLKEKVGDSLGLGTVLLNLANSYFYTNQLELGLEYLERSQEIAEKLNSTWLQQYAYRGLGVYYRKAGDIETSNSWFHRSAHLLKKRPNSDYALINSIYKGLKENHIQLNNIDSSLYYQTQLNNIAINLVEKEKQEIQNRAKVNSSIIRKNSEIKSLKEKEATRRKIYFIVIVVLVIIILFGLIINRQRNKVLIERNLTIAKEKELLAMKSRFISTASHQFRTPLAVIQSSVGLLAMQRDKMDEDLQLSFDKSYKRIKDYIDLMTTLMDQVLTTETIANKSVEFKKTPLDIEELSIDIVKSHNEIQKDGRQIEFYSKGKATLIPINEKVMIHSLSNLVSNAFKYSANRPPPKLTIQFEKDHVTISVLDHGIGISNEDQKHLFEPFYRGSNALDYLGTGLGLTITKEYISAMGGTIEVNSKVGNGAEFIIKLSYN